MVSFIKSYSNLILLLKAVQDERGPRKLKRVKNQAKIQQNPSTHNNQAQSTRKNIESMKVPTNERPLLMRFKHEIADTSSHHSLVIPTQSNNPMIPELPYNPWGSLSLSPELIDLRLAAARYASAFSPIKPTFYNDNYENYQNNILSQQQSWVSGFQTFFSKHYDPRHLLMLSNWKDILSSNNSINGHPLTCTNTLISTTNSLTGKSQ